MAVEFVGVVIILAAWIVEMNENLKEKEHNKNRHKFLIFYIIGFLSLAYYSSQINSLVLTFFFGLLALINLIEFAFLMIKRK